ncbi:response regulator transcription factor [Leptospira sp. GIMC2001]|uniref:response regulator transcription factor n=1 Tax=Leptospira sp. GIMC2001 TaxID=1513297 RepID=UPI00234B11E5|nr:response regulator [Leptospira sp. GIMC2001]WCL48302.1 response regulator [Leptospira sp. GIMC2001]
MNTKHILIVEDIHSIREGIKDLLSTNYLVSDAENYDQAIEILQNTKIDLVITDIRMPGKSGLDLVEYIRTNYPNIIYSLITAYNINDYIHFAKEHDVWNIIPKYSFLDIKVIEVMVYKLLTKDIFGVEKYFDSDFEVITNRADKPYEDPPKSGIIYKTIKSDRERNILTGKISKFMIQNGAPKSIQQVLEELTSNAMIRAPKDNDGRYKYQFEIPSNDLIVPLENIDLQPEDYFTIGYGQSKDSFILVTQDRFGSLRKDEILHRLDRHITSDDTTGFPVGISDSHGRGLYICREISDQLIFNIKHDQKTEIISLIDKSGRSGFKSLSIYEN